MFRPLLPFHHCLNPDSIEEKGEEDALTEAVSALPAKALEAAQRAVPTAAARRCLRVFIVGLLTGYGFAWRETKLSGHAGITNCVLSQFRHMNPPLFRSSNSAVVTTDCRESLKVLAQRRRGAEMCKTDVDPPPLLEDYPKGFMTYPEDQTRPHVVHGENTFIHIIHTLFLRVSAPLRE